MHVLQYNILFCQFHSCLIVVWGNFHSTSNKCNQLWQNHTHKKKNNSRLPIQMKCNWNAKMNITKTNKYYSCSWANPKPPAIKKTKKKQEKLKAYKKRKYTETFHNLYSDIHRWLIEKKTKKFGVVIALVGDIHVKCL